VRRQHQRAASCGSQRPLSPGPAPAGVHRALVHVAQRRRASAPRTRSTALALSLRCASLLLCARVGAYGWCVRAGARARGRACGRAVAHSAMPSLRWAPAERGAGGRRERARRKVASTADPRAKGAFTRAWVASLPGRSAHHFLVCARLCATQRARIEKESDRGREGGEDVLFCGSADALV
jgi:hypothetical protein